MNQSLAFRYIATPNGILPDRRIEFDDHGTITAVEADSGPFDGWFALPGMPNAHSHAFQRALTGCGERAGEQGSFRDWREAMYRLANRLDAEDLYTIARQAYGEMLCGGYTSVAEFHYLHHARDGSAGAEMGQAIVEAARDAGIRLLLLPVFFRDGDFGEPARPEQRRFVHRAVDAYCRLLQALPHGHMGIAPHSLRTVPPELLAPLIESASEILGRRVPIHMHVAEQADEVEACLEHYAQTPIVLLSRSVALGPRWSLVHATHASEAELDLLAGAEVNLVLCPLTEAYLGDGLFPAEEYLHQDGRIAIGSDSNVRIDAVEELRLLEYGQRLRCRRRGCLAGSDGLGAPLWSRLCRGGANALGLDIGALEPGLAADIVVLDRSQPPLAGPVPGRVLDALITGGSNRNIADVYVGGVKRVEGGEPVAAADTADHFEAVVRRVCSE